jgi:hypothetical protein
LDLLRAFLIDAQTKLIATRALLSGVMEKIDESYWAACADWKKLPC